MILLSGIFKKYKTRSEGIEALKNINLSFEDSGLTFIVGKSGSGKSSLLNILGGLDFDYTGTVKFDDYIYPKSDSINDFKKNNIGFVHQCSYLIEEYNVSDNIALSLELNGTDAENEKIDSVLQSVDLSGYAKRKVSELSGGEKQRVAIARALIKDPSFLLCDEPTGALDGNTSESVYILLKKISEKIPVIVVSHDNEGAEKFADRIIKITDGTISEDRVIHNISSECKNKIQKTKTNFSLKGKIKYLFSLMKIKPKTLVFSIIYTMVTFTLFGISSSFAFQNKYKVLADTMNSNNLNYVILEKNIQKNGRSSAIRFTDSDIDKIPGSKFIFSTRLRNIENYADLSSSYYYSCNLNGCYNLTDNEIKEYDFNLYGRLPKNIDEIALPIYIYDKFCDQGYTFENQKYDISGYEDMIGKKIILNSESDSFTFTVCGVVDTNFDFSTFKNLDSYSNNPMMEMYLDNYLKYSLNNVLFVDETYYNVFDKDIDYSSISSSQIDYLSLSLCNNMFFPDKLSAVGEKNIYFFDKEKSSLNMNETVLPYSFINRVCESGYNLAIIEYSKNHFDLIKEQFELSHGTSSYFDYADYIIQNDYQDETYLNLTKEDILSIVFQYYLLENDYTDEIILWCGDINKKMKVCGFYNDYVYGENMALLSDSQMSELVSESEYILSPVKYLVCCDKGISEKKLSEYESVYSGNITVADSDYTYAYKVQNLYKCIQDNSETSLSFGKILFFFSILLLCSEFILGIYYLYDLFKRKIKAVCIHCVLGAKKSELMFLHILLSLFYSLIKYSLSIVILTLSGRIMNKVININNIACLNYINFNVLLISLIPLILTIFYSLFSLSLFINKNKNMYLILHNLD